MPKKHDKNGVPHIEVDNAEEAMRKTMEFGRQILDVSKKKIDQRLTAEKAEKNKKRR